MGSNSALERLMGSPYPLRQPSPSATAGLGPDENVLEGRYKPELLETFVINREAVLEDNHMVPLLQKEYYFRLLLAESRKQTAEAEIQTAEAKRQTDLLERIAARLDEQARVPA